MTLLHEPFKKHLGWNKRLFTFPFKNGTQIIRYCNHIYTNNSENQSILAFVIFGIKFLTSTYSPYFRTRRLHPRMNRQINNSICKLSVFNKCYRNIYIDTERSLHYMENSFSDRKKKSFYYFWIGKDIQIKNNKQLEWLSSLLTWSICDYSTYESRYDPHLYIGKMERIWCKGKEQSLKRGPTYNRLKKAVKKGNFLVWKKVFYSLLNTKKCLIQWINI